MQNSIKACFESSTFKGRPWRPGVSNYCWVGVVAAAAHWKQQRGGKSAPQPTRRSAVSSPHPAALWDFELLKIYLPFTPQWSQTWDLAPCLPLPCPVGHWLHSSQVRCPRFQHCLSDTTASRETLSNQAPHNSPTELWGLSYSVPQSLPWISFHLKAELQCPPPPV